MRSIDVVLAALEERGCRPKGAENRGWVSLCCAHDDRSPSLSVSYRDGKCLLHCHAGCEPQAIIDAMGLEWVDLWDEARV